MIEIKLKNGEVIHWDKVVWYRTGYIFLFEKYEDSRSVPKRTISMGDVDYICN